MSTSHHSETPPNSWPQELRLSKDRRVLMVTFEDGATFPLSAEYLRVMSPSAEVQGHGPNQRKTIGGKRNVEIIKIEQVGNYAVKLVFDDMHDTGIYGWDALYTLGLSHETNWASYLAELDGKGLNRDRV
jgi:DUF971 family protein